MERRASLSSRRQVFATRDPEQARAFVALRGFLLDVPPRDGVTCSLTAYIRRAFVSFISDTAPRRRSGPLEISTTTAL